MPLTNSQIQTLKTFVSASTDPAIVDARTRGDTYVLAQLLNAPASPAVLAWGQNVDPATMDDAPDYSTFDSIAAGKRDSWGFFLARARNLGRNKTRKWITDVWGNATAGSNAEAILLAGTVNATLAEATIGGSSKVTGTVSAIDRNFVGQVTQDEARLILAA